MPKNAKNATRPNEETQNLAGSHEPSRDCPLCPRLVAFRHSVRAREPSWFNAPVPSFGSADARLLIVGLAPGLRGANRTGRPFTGDYAGDLLFRTLVETGFARGRYEARPDDDLTLVDARIANAVRCVPPENTPMPAEIRSCRRFLEQTIADMARLRVIVALGRIAHDSVTATLGARRSTYPFGHGARHTVGRMDLFDSYHCSRQNTNTRTLTPEMFRAVFAAVRAVLDEGT